MQKKEPIGKLKHIISWAIWAVVLLLILLFILPRIPAVQSRIGSGVSDMLGQELGTSVSIGKVYVGLPNRIIIDDVQIDDQTGSAMLEASRVSSKIDILPLMRGKVRVSSAQLFGMHAHLSKDSLGGPYNFQFVIDSLQSGDQSQSRPLDLSVKSLIIRNGAIDYDIKDQPLQAEQLDPNHIHVKDLSSHIMLNRLTDQSIDLKVKRLSLNEQSGLRINELTFDLAADSCGARVQRLALRLPRSHVNIEDAEVRYSLRDGELVPGSLAYSTRLSDTRVNPADLSFVRRSLSGHAESYEIETELQGTSRAIDVKSVHVRSTDGQVNIQGSGKYNSHGSEWIAHVNDLKLGSAAVSKIAAETGSKIQIPATLLRLGDIHFVGDLGGKGSQYSCIGNLGTDVGAASVALDLQGSTYSGRVETELLDLGRLLDDEHLGLLSADVHVAGHLPIDKSTSLIANGNIYRLDYNGHTYDNIGIDGQYTDMHFKGALSMDDPDGYVDLTGEIDLSGPEPLADLRGTVQHLNPSALNLTTATGDRVFDFDIDANISGSDPMRLNGYVDINDLTMTYPEGMLTLSNLHLDSDNTSESGNMQLQSDFGQVSISGQYDFGDIGNAIARIVKDKLPNIPFIPTPSGIGRNDFSFEASITDDNWLKAAGISGLDIGSDLRIDGHISDKASVLDINCRTSSLSYNGDQYRDLRLESYSSGGALHVNASVKKIDDDGIPMDISLVSDAKDDNLSTDLSFDNHGDNLKVSGTLSLNSSFYVNKHQEPAAHIVVHPSAISINDTLWQVEPSDILVSKSRVMVDHFEIGNTGQHLSIYGTLTDNANDSLVADLSDINIRFFSDILHVRGVDFGGLASGRVVARDIYNRPMANARLHVKGFSFEDGYMGETDIAATFDAESNKISINALADAGDDRLTDITGYVQLSPGELELNIDSRGTPIEFVERFCGSFMDNIHASVDGHFHVFGPLSAVNLEGIGVANGDVDITSLNTTYTLHNDTIRLVPDRIIFSSDTVLDRNRNIGIVNGQVMHHNLSDFTYDIDIDATDMLCYDFRDFGDNTFCGTVYATGHCNIQNLNGDINIDVEATPTANTVFTYNAASPDALSDQDFITWNDVTVHPADISYYDVPKSQSVMIDKDDIPSDMHINFLINATDAATLRVIMDSQSGDYIALNGNGVLRASYFNKGAFSLYGNYLVNSGTYKLTIQNVIKRDFSFQPGSSISFGGDPYAAALDLRALYTANSVPLSDLNIGQSFTSNNIRVNCLMNIKGTPAQPTVDFDLEMPTVSSDAQQMVRSLINSEEELNQQVIYLLTIGRFYNQNATVEEGSQSQTSLAMQSLLSGTISQQINALLGNFINTSKWNFGANISTGDEGWNNAEYEGLLSGKLLNNRLLINGQFGYRDNANATTSFIGDFDIQYLLYPNGNLAINVYNQSNDRYFTKNSLTTQGVGLIMKKDFNGWRELLRLKSRKKKTTIQTHENQQNTDSVSHTDYGSHSRASKDQESGVKDNRDQ